jgi:hypothetical protein
MIKPIEFAHGISYGIIIVSIGLSIFCGSDGFRIRIPVEKIIFPMIQIGQRIKLLFGELVVRHGDAIEMSEKLTINVEVFSGFTKGSVFMIIAAQGFSHSST